MFNLTTVMAGGGVMGASADLYDFQEYSHI